MVVQANGYDNLTFGEKDCRNYIDKLRRLRLGIGDAEAIRNYFVGMQRKNSHFFYVMDVDDSSHLRNVFWADARCRAAYEYFGEVITFDTTYLTNKYDMPFAPFVGVNHHGQSILLGCALLSNEDTETFTWLFTTWLACMNGRAPNAIITDQDRAMKNAIEAVFPKARHRWCLWHIMKKVPEKLGRHSDYESIKILLHDAVYDSSSISDFMEKWEKMIESYELHDNDWLKGLFDERHRWAPVYVRDTFWAGMSTTQRSESMNSFFDGHILCVLNLTGKTESVPSSYILPRWRKDIKRRHTLIKCSFDQLAGNEELQRVSKACDAFYEVASLGIQTEDDLLKVMNWIKDLKIELTCKQSPPEVIERDSLVQKQRNKILDPKEARSKGRPPFKRKASKVDQVVKKKLVGKKTQKRNKKSNNYQSQEEGPSISKAQDYEDFSTSQSIDLNVIGTQESIQAPNYSQSINSNISYSELLQAQHHINDRPLS
ncbi:hypothetical protein L195_g027153 [Trifolium pratense]|uniref:MULE transposase domain-containing protein n=1 Tax=Trifolium pratense TaxID=57577 RepID=A0A2K3KYB2_TRIPR|nr:hypothetical protein L195_g027153 [Trifolium pratense]